MKVAFAVVVVVAGVAAAPALADKPYAQGYRWISDAPQPTSFITDTLAPGGGKAAPARSIKGQPQGYTFITDTLAPGGGASERPVTVSVGHSFAWTDAGVGALVSAGALLILLGGTVLVRVRLRPAV